MKRSWVVLLCLSGCPTPHLGTDPVSFPRVCTAIQPTLGSSGMTCLELSGEQRAGIWGPQDSPNNNSVEACFSGHPPAALLETRSGGGMTISYEASSKTGANAGFQLKQLSDWAPDLGIDFSAQSDVAIEVEFIDRQIVVVRDLYRHLGDQFDGATPGSADSNAARDCLQQMCTTCGGDKPCYLAAEALLAKPKLTLRDKRGKSIKAAAGWNVGGFSVNSTSAASGVVTLVSETPLVIAARLLPTKELLNTRCQNVTAGVDLTAPVKISGLKTYTSDTVIKGKDISFLDGTVLRVENGATLRIEAEQVHFLGSVKIDGRGAPGAAGRAGRDGTGGGFEPGCRAEASDKEADGRPRWSTSNGGDFSSANTDCDHKPGHCDRGGAGDRGADGGPGAKIFISASKKVKTGTFSLDLEGGAPGPGGPGGRGMAHVSGGARHVCPAGGSGPTGNQGPSGTCQLSLAGQIMPCI
jgi:hypothetical protein